MLTSIVMAAVMGFVLVDRSVQNYRLSGTQPMVTVSQKGPLEIEASIFGRQFFLPMEALNQTAAFLQRYAPFFFPAPMRLAGQLTVAGAQGWKQLENQRREADYQRYVQEDQAAQREEAANGQAH